MKVIDLSGAVVSVITFVGGHLLGQHRARSEEKRKRLEAVCNRYLQARRIGQFAGIGGLQKAGVGTLRNDAEVREVLSMIIQHGEGDPLQRPAVMIDDLDLLQFFQLASQRGIDLNHSADLVKFIEEYRKRA